MARSPLDPLPIPKLSVGRKPGVFQVCLIAKVPDPVGSMTGFSLVKNFFGVFS